ncbi:hypothetical protein PVK06_011311 [Gossypium arboreum]|uniref:Reverse transcriptase n=1 Tax=Gossypium arboreum TaxID=29729 RepID=A0ABR0Q8M3_GOSAR|nr:hypothetical protein PVK06_011311 [Gossypium arboreum]
MTGIDQCVHQKDNRQLTAPYTKEEIQEAVFTMRLTKAPGEDGLPDLFYQKCWHIIGEEVTSFCLQLLNGDMEVIVNQFRGVIEKCIDGAQSAFVPGRLISDNVLLAYEILHMLKHKRSGKKGYMAVKLNMSKAYDRVEWNFIREIMIQMGFDQKWVDALMKCVTTVSYSVVINGHIG